MAIEYLGLSAINGPMVVLEGISGAAYDEIVEMTVDGKKRKLGRIIEVYEDKAVIQVPVHIIMIIDRGQFFSDLLRIQIIRAAQILKTAVIVPKLRV